MEWPSWTYWVLLPFATIGAWRACHWLFAVFELLHESLRVRWETAHRHHH